MQNPHVEAQLQSLVAQYGNVLVTDHKRLEALLKDVCSGHLLETNLLVAASRIKVADELSRLEADELHSRTFKRFVNRLSGDLGIAQEKAEWAVWCWAKALGKDTTECQSTLSNTIGTAPGNAPLKVNVQPVLAVATGAVTATSHVEQKSVAVQGQPYVSQNSSSSPGTTYPVATSAYPVAAQSGNTTQQSSSMGSHSTLASASSSSSVSTGLFQILSRPWSKFLAACLLIVVLVALNSLRVFFFGTTNTLATSAGTTSPIVESGEPVINAKRVQKIQIAGKPIMEAPVHIGDTEILAPIVGDKSALLQKLGVSATRLASNNAPDGLNMAHSLQINVSEGPPVILTIGKAVAYVNKQERPLKAAPQVINGKIWLPIFSLAPMLGASTRLNPADGTLHVNPTLQSVELFTAKGYTVMTVKASAPLETSAVKMGNVGSPPKIYFDFPGYSMGFDAAGTTGERVVSPGLNEVQQVRAGMVESFPDITRVVVDLNKKVKASVQQLPDKTLYTIILTPTNSSTNTAPNLTRLDFNNQQLQSSTSLQDVRIENSLESNPREANEEAAKAKQLVNDVDESNLRLEKLGRQKLLTEQILAKEEKKIKQKCHLALLHCERALKIQPAHEIALVQKVSALYVLARYSQAKRTLQNALRHYPSNVELKDLEQMLKQKGHQI